MARPPLSTLRVRDSSRAVLEEVSWLFNSVFLLLSRFRVRMLSREDRSRRMVGSRSRVYAVVKGCIAVLTPSTMFCMGTQIYLLATKSVDGRMRANCALLLTTSVLTTLFLGAWFTARTSPRSRTPSALAKRIAFAFSLPSTILWLAGLCTGMAVARDQPTCRDPPLYVPASFWVDGLPCRLHRISVAFSIFGFISSLAVLASMIEISDRPFGGRSTQAKISWTQDQFLELLKEFNDPERRPQAMRDLFGHDYLENLSDGRHIRRKSKLAGINQPSSIEELDGSTEGSSSDSHRSSSRSSCSCCCSRDGSLVTDSSDDSLARPPRVWFGPGVHGR